MRIADLYAPDVVGTDLHLARLDMLRAEGDVVELDAASTRRTFIALSDAAVRSLASSPSLTSRYGTGLTDAREAGVDGVPYHAINASDGASHTALRASLIHLADPGATSPRGPLVIADLVQAAFMNDVIDVFALARAMQARAMRTSFAHVSDADYERGINLAHRAAFAWHDEVPSPERVFADVDAALVELARRNGASDDTSAWLMRFSFLTAFVTTELAVVSMIERALVATHRGPHCTSNAPAPLPKGAAPVVSAGTASHFVNESLRVQAPVARFGRVTIDDVTIETPRGPVLIPRGARVILSFAAACHDKAASPDKPSLAFGAGPHACAGAAVAVGIMRAVYDAVVAVIEPAPRFESPTFTVVERTVLRSTVNRGLRSLLLTRAPS